MPCQFTPRGTTRATGHMRVTAESHAYPADTKTKNSPEVRGAFVVSTTDTLRERIASLNNVLRRLAVNTLLISLLTTDAWHPVRGYHLNTKQNKVRLDVACHTKADRVLAKTIMEAFGKLVEGDTFTVAKAEEIPKSN